MSRVIADGLSARGKVDSGVADVNGDYANLRARATTKDDVGLGAVRNVASYSQGEANNRYVQDMRLGTAQSSAQASDPGTNVWLSAPDGHCATAIYQAWSFADNMITAIRYKPIQKNINGSWFTIGG